MLHKINYTKNHITFLNHPVINFLLRTLTILSLITAIVVVITLFDGITSHISLAEDLLSGTATDLYDTVNGTGKKFLYLIEIVVAFGSYIKTKNLWVLTGVITIAIAFDIFLKVAGF